METAASRSVVHVQDRWLSLRLSSPPRSVAKALVVFMTGDGGWHGKDLDAFDHITEWGYPVAGMSAPDYLDHLGNRAAQLSPRQLALDLKDVIDTARARLDLRATTPVLLFGVSRGADLVVVAAAQRTLRSSVRGVLAVGLTKEEEYVARRRGKRSLAPTPGQTTAMDRAMLFVHPYAALRRVLAPVGVIQATNDEYVPAAVARRMFGPDTASRRLWAIEARNHSFSDARQELYAAMRDSLLWVSSHSL